MSDAAQAGFDAAKNDRAGSLARAGEIGETTYEVGVDDGGAVGAAIVDPARGVIVGTAFLLKGGVVGHHGIDCAGGDSPEEDWLAQAADIGGFIDVWLGDDTDAVACLEEQLADEGGADEGAVDIAVAGDEDDVERVPA